MSFVPWVKALWESWNLKGLLLGSLILQILLLFVAPFRKQTSNGMVMLSVWMAYLLSAYMANQAIGIIYREISDNVLRTGVDLNGPSSPHPDLLAFWAPFLLIHLGGPDSITALAMEDNELWVRSTLELGTQLIVVGRVYLTFVPRKVSSWATTFIFYAGVIKYTERAICFFHARLTKFKSSILSDPDPNYAKLMDRYGGSSHPTRIMSNYESVNGEIKLREVELVRDAYVFFEKYKGLFVDLIFSDTDRQESRSYFLKRTDEQAFKLIEIELNLTYEVFYTKMVLTYKAVGKFLRFHTLCLEVFSLVIWFFTSKRYFRLSDVRLTYGLLIGAIVVDVVSFVRAMFSDWQIAHIPKSSTIRTRIFDYLLSFCEIHDEEATLTAWFRRIFLRRWSETISQFNLMNFCVDTWGEGMDKFLQFSMLGDKLDQVCYVTKKWFTNDLRGFIFKQLKHKSKMPSTTDPDNVCSFRGDRVLESMGLADLLDPSSLNPWTIMVEYDESLLLWHIATEICYQQERDVSPQLKLKWYNKLWACLTLRKHNNTPPPPPSSSSSSMPEEKDYREFSKTISDYLMYLLIMQPQMMYAASGISELRYKQTCAEAKKFFKKTRNPSNDNLTKESRHQDACNRIFMVNMNVNPEEIKSDNSKSVMFNALCLAKKLNELHDKTNNKWEITAKVWVDLLCYAATHIRPNAHAAQLKQGGELLTLVWLLMVHLGPGNQFRVTEGLLTSNLIMP